MSKEHMQSNESSAGTDESRRSFLKQAIGTAAVTLTATALAGNGVSVQGRPSAEELLQQEEPLPDLPPGLEGEHIIKRMMEDLQRALRKPMNERKWGMVIDLRKCVGCNGCTIACIAENKLPPGMAYRPVLPQVRGEYPHVARLFIPRPCMQCENPPCVEVCPVGATWKREDGIVVIDYDQCIGCRYCITACPYSARSFDSGFFYSDFMGGEPQPYELLPSPEYGELRERKEGQSPIGNARKCHFCIHRVEKGELPACVLTCVGHATYFGDLNDPKSLVSQLVGQPNVMRLKEELGTEPKVFYLL